MKDLTVKTIIGSISVIEIQKQINSATLQLLQEYSQILKTNNAKAVEDFLFDVIHKKDSKRIDLHGNGFKVSACVLGLDLEYQHLSLVRAMKYGLRDADGCETIKCSFSKDEKSVEFWYNATQKTNI